MSAAQSWREIEIPRDMRTLPRDQRGFPVPYIVWHDKAKRPHFPISDQAKVGKCVRGRLCAICGKRMGAVGWFIGGPGSFIAPNGAFLDPPTHEECGRYAARVCPYLAAPSYARRIDDRNVKPEAIPAGAGIATEPAVEERPPFFIFGAVAEWMILPGNAPGMVVLRPASEWLDLELWRRGELVGPEETGRLLAEAAAPWLKGRAS